MKEIKFRQPLFKSNGDFLRWHYWGDTEGGFTSPVAGNLGRNSQQYTNMKDKNGREIYKGDIIQSKSELIKLMTNKPTGRFKIENYEVKWETERGRWGRWKDNKFELLGGLRQSYLTKGYEIIGNIYENPIPLKEVREDG